MKNIDFEIELKKYLEQSNSHNEIKDLIMTEIKSAYIAGWHSATEKFYKEKDNIKLIPFNSAHSTQIYHASQVKIQGILSGLLRSYH